MLVDLYCDFIPVFYAADHVWSFFA